MRCKSYAKIKKRGMRKEVKLKAIKKNVMLSISEASLS
jgi:hypothetical protein